MVKRKRVNISREKKEQIIKELIDNSSDIKTLAVKYQVTAKTLSKWRSNYYKAGQERQSTKPEEHFVEVQVRDDIRKRRLKKVELILDDYKCSIEGRLNSEQLIKLLQLLEEASC